jgi:hypothetical protein
MLIINIMLSRHGKDLKKKANTSVIKEDKTKFAK